MKLLTLTASLGLLAAPALADIEKRVSPNSVAETMDKLEAAVRGARATVFARVDHAGGAASVDMDLPASQLLIFGNPKLGTPAMQADILAGLFLPLKVLVYEDAEGQVQIAYEEVKETFEDLNVDDDAAFIEKMEGALEALTSKASSEN